MEMEGETTCLDLWSTNGTHVWPTTDPDTIAAIGHLIAIVPKDDEGNTGTAQATARCRQIVDGVNRVLAETLGLRYPDR